MTRILWLFLRLSPTYVQQLVTYGRCSLPFHYQCLKSLIKHQTIYHLNGRKGRKQQHTTLD